MYIKLHVYIVLVQTNPHKQDIKTFLKMYKDVGTAMPKCTQTRCRDPKAIPTSCINVPMMATHFTLYHNVDSSQHSFCCQGWSDLDAMRLQKNVCMSC